MNGRAMHAAPPTPLTHRNRVLYSPSLQTHETHRCCLWYMPRVAHGEADNSHKTLLYYLCVPQGRRLQYRECGSHPTTAAFQPGLRVVSRLRACFCKSALQHEETCTLLH